jgi:hypothetical protein
LLFMRRESCVMRRRTICRPVRAGATRLSTPCGTSRASCENCSFGVACCISPACHKELSAVDLERRRLEGTKADHLGACPRGVMIDNARENNKEQSSLPAHGNAFRSSQSEEIKEL